MATNGGSKLQIVVRNDNKLGPRWQKIVAEMAKNCGRNDEIVAKMAEKCPCGLVKRMSVWTCEKNVRVDL